jgi:hypothetical protein
VSFKALASIGFPRFAVLLSSVRETGVQTFVPGPPEIGTG